MRCGYYNFYTCCQIPFFVKWHFNMFMFLILLKQKITMKFNNLFVLIVLGFIRDHQTADVTTTTPTTPNLLRSISTPFGSSLDQPNQDKRQNLVGKLSEMINRLQRWANDISRQPKQKIKSRGNDNQRFLCFGHEVFCKELVYINSADNWEDYAENMEEAKDPSEAYLPVGFLNPLLVHQSEKMYENLNKNLNKVKSYRASLFRTNAQKSMADRVF